jgi:hypothetical protein
VIVLDKIRSLRRPIRPARHDIPADAPVAIDGDDPNESAENEVVANDGGMSTAEYAVGTIAACALATVRRSTT